MEQECNAASSDVCVQSSALRRGGVACCGGESVLEVGSLWGGAESAGEIVMCPELMTKGPFMCRARR